MSDRLDLICIIDIPKLVIRAAMSGKTVTPTKCQSESGHAILRPLNKSLPVHPDGCTMSTLLPTVISITGLALSQSIGLARDAIVSHDIFAYYRCMRVCNV